MVEPFREYNDPRPASDKLLVNVPRETVSPEVRADFERSRNQFPVLMPGTGRGNPKFFSMFERVVFVVAALVVIFTGVLLAGGLIELMIFVAELRQKIDSFGGNNDLLTP